MDANKQVTDAWRGLARRSPVYRRAATAFQNSSSLELQAQSATETPERRNQLNLSVPRAYGQLALCQKVVTFRACFPTPKPHFGERLPDAKVQIRPNLVSSLPIGIHARERLVIYPFVADREVRAALRNLSGKFRGNGLT